MHRGRLEGFIYTSELDSNCILISEFEPNKPPTISGPKCITEENKDFVYISPDAINLVSNYGNTSITYDATRNHVCLAKTAGEIVRVSNS